MIRREKEKERKREREKERKKEREKDRRREKEKERKGEREKRERENVFANITNKILFNSPKLKISQNFPKLQKWMKYENLTIFL